MPPKGLSSLKEKAKHAKEHVHEVADGNVVDNIKEKKHEHTLKKWHGAVLTLGPDSNPLDVKNAFKGNEAWAELKNHVTEHKVKREVKIELTVSTANKITDKLLTSAATKMQHKITFSLLEGMSNAGQLGERFPVENQHLRSILNAGFSGLLLSYRYEALSTSQMAYYRAVAVARIAQAVAALFKEVADKAEGKVAATLAQLKQAVEECRATLQENLGAAVETLLNHEHPDSDFAAMADFLKSHVESKVGPLIEKLIEGFRPVLELVESYLSDAEKLNPMNFQDSVLVGKATLHIEGLYSELLESSGHFAGAMLSMVAAYAKEEKEGKEDD